MKMYFSKILLIAATIVTHIAKHIQMKTVNVYSMEIKQMHINPLLPAAPVLYR